MNNKYKKELGKHLNNSKATINFYTPGLKRHFVH